MVSIKPGMASLLLLPFATAVAVCWPCYAAGYTSLRKLFQMAVINSNSNVMEGKSTRGTLSNANEPCNRLAAAQEVYQNQTINAI